MSIRESLSRPEIFRVPGTFYFVETVLVQYRYRTVFSIVYRVLFFAMAWHASRRSSYGSSYARRFDVQKYSISAVLYRNFVRLPSRRLSRRLPTLDIVTVRALTPYLDARPAALTMRPRPTPVQSPTVPCAVTTKPLPLTQCRPLRGAIPSRRRPRRWRHE